MTLLANKIYQGDCIERLGEVEPGSVDLVFADPPFNIGYEYDEEQNYGFASVHTSEVEVSRTSTLKATVHPPPQRD